MSVDLVRSMLKANLYKFWSWNLLVKYKSCNIMLFDCLICLHWLKILLGDVRRTVVAFADDKIQETWFQAIIINAA